MKKTFRLILWNALMCSGFSAKAGDDQLSTGLKAIHSMAGCYLVDYSYVETQSLKAGYERDQRVYDVNKRVSMKEWVYAENLSPTRVHLQHILFGTDSKGNVLEGVLLKHQGEDWEYGASFLYDFVSPLNWSIKDLSSTPNLWTRRITNLDDGLRYQCASSWSNERAYPEWSCSNFAPIPGRETRDMKRRDYNTLERTTRLVLYGNSWLERQDNTKVIFNNDGVKEPLAKELGKNWYVRLPHDECLPVQDFVSQRKPFWTLLRETWDEVLSLGQPFQEKSPKSGPTRYEKIMDLEEWYKDKDLLHRITRSNAKAAIKEIINEFSALNH